MLVGWRSNEPGFRSGPSRREGFFRGDRGDGEDARARNRAVSDHLPRKDGAPERLKRLRRIEYIRFLRGCRGNNQQYGRPRKPDEGYIDFYLAR
ncbi:hypothetical protein K32_06630 [Kaistia sp. 32K]|nr:hypothetical protein K32_06630 [Kaistia sp. 32K]